MKLAVRRTPIRVPGFLFAGVRCGLKASGKRDIGLIVSERPATAVGVFTTNRVQAAPVRIGAERLESGKAQAILVNSGNANAYTGRDGERVARDMTAVAARLLGIDERLVIPSSTGKIGVQLPRAMVRRGVAAACQALAPGNFHAALEGIMTTDAFPKFAFERVVLDGCRVTVAGMAKGAGMIAPNMATMLAYVLTDARVSHATLRHMVRSGLPASFNAIVVDGDMSTNDTLVVLANGAAKNGPVSRRAADRLREALHAVMARLARAIVRDGEGGTKVVDVHVRGGRTAADAARVADAVARSPLCKTAFYGGDPYAGRIVCAIGYSGARLDPSSLDVAIDGVPIVRRGVDVGGRSERRAARAMARPEFALHIDLHAGPGTAYRMASDLTPAYVKFNSDYRT
jgi:glutamate N-acetyltransferase/amino-acid N-acetyltransferase